MLERDLLLLLPFLGWEDLIFLHNQFSILACGVVHAVLKTLEYLYFWGLLAGSINSSKNVLLSDWRFFLTEKIENFGSSQSSVDITLLY